MAMRSKRTMLNRRALGADRAVVRGRVKDDRGAPERTTGASWRGAVDRAYGGAVAGHAAVLRKVEHGVQTFSALDGEGRFPADV